MIGIALSLSFFPPFNLSFLLSIFPPSIVGTSFYLMEYVEGRIFKDASLPLLKPDERSVIISIYHQFDFCWIVGDLFKDVRGLSLNT